MYTLIAYKPDSVDICRGCQMASYSSDFCLEEGLDADGLTARWASFLLKNKNMQQNEDGYDFVILRDGKVVYENGVAGVTCDYGYQDDEESSAQMAQWEQEVSHIEIVAKTQVEELHKAKLEREAAARKAQADKEAAAAQKRKRDVYERLKKEFELNDQNREKT